MTRSNMAMAGALCLLAVLAGVRLLGGDPGIDLQAILRGDDQEQAILTHFRGPRVILAMMTGAALAMAGTVSQVMLRNPLASPDIIGFTAGASAAAAAAILIFGDISAAMPGALAGGILAACLVFGLAWRDGISPLALVLVGVALNLMLITATDILLSLSPGILASEATRFLTGSFASADWRSAGLMALACLVLGGVLAGLAFAIDRLELGDDLAVTLGLAPDRIRFCATVCIALIVAVSVAVAGPIPFIAFLAGPLARLAAARPGTVLGLSAVIGAILGIGADLLATLPIAGIRLPAGVFTALIGAPAMLLLLLRLEVDRK